MLHKISLVGILVFSLGCMKIQKKEEGKDQNQNVDQPAPQTSSSSNEKEQEHKQELINELDFEYVNESDEVQFKFPSHWPHEVVVEKHRKTEKVFSRKISKLNNGWKDKIENSEKAHYKFFAKMSEQFIFLDEIEVLPILDLHLTTDYRLDEVYEIGQRIRKIRIRNLVLEKNAKIFIGAFKGQLQIDQLRSENGSIQTFPVGQRAVEKDGRNVGGFHLDIRSAQGELNLALVAESGAHGLNGNEPDLSLTGTAGSDGEPSSFKARGGDACAGFSRGQICLVRTVYDCATEPGRGMTGGQGLAGFPGGDGSRGGSVEKVKLQNIPSSLKIEISRIVGEKGQGGEGGKGGKGGPGGKGGDGGKKDFLRVMKIDLQDPQNALFAGMLGKTCMPAAEGFQGPQGDKGLHGRDGSDGVVF